MSRTVVVHQPDFLPYLGFFHRFLRADVYLALDHVQFVQHTSRAWTHRDKIKTRGGAAWLSVSVQKCPLDTAIKDVELSSDRSWRAANLNLLTENYRRAPFYETIFARLDEIYRMPIDRLAAFNMAFIDLVCDWLGIAIERARSSDLAPTDRKSEMIAGLVAAVGGTRYLSGIGARDYHDQAPFERRGIEVVWQDFKHPIYPQQFGEFVPYLSTIDALFNCGPEETIRMLRSS
jgi:hypothetical protein